jgi:hypothetical protein
LAFARGHRDLRSRASCGLGADIHTQIIKQPMATNTAIVSNLRPDKRSMVSSLGGVHQVAKLANRP